MTQNYEYTTNDLLKNPQKYYMTKYEEILLRIRKEITDRNDSAKNSQDKNNEIVNELRKLGYL